MEPARRATPKSDLYSIIRELEDPRLIPQNPASNDDYRADLEALGVLYAYYICHVATGYSPAKMEAKWGGNLSGSYSRELQKKFQQQSRKFFYRVLGEVARTELNRENLKTRYLPEIKGNFSPDTVEDVVADLAQAGNFALIGEKLKEGAEAYHREAEQRHMSNYCFSSEYKAILKVLKGK